MGVARERIGVFGGTFDPPHVGHVAVVRFVLSEGLVDRVLVIPTGQPWMREQGPLASAADRLAMTGLAFGDITNVEVLDVETRRPGVTYTVDTMAELRQTDDGYASFILILGIDSARTLDRWNGHDRLLGMCELLVIGRPGEKGPSDLPSGHPSRGARFVEGPMSDVSATEIRRRVANGEDVTRLVPPAVAAYVREHGLYGAVAGAERENTG